MSNPKLEGLGVLAIVCLATALLALFLQVELDLTGGELGVPLDDAWIHYQFARNLSRGNGFGYNPGEPTAGSTAPLWTLLLAGVGLFSESFVYLSPQAAEVCGKKKLGLVGIDYVTIDKFGETSSPAHHKLLGNDILILEAINLKDVPPGKYTLLCLPLKIKGCEGSPVRAVLLK